MPGVTAGSSRKWAAESDRRRAERQLQLQLDAVADAGAHQVGERLVTVAQFAVVYLIAQAGIVCFVLLLTGLGSLWGLLGLAGAVTCAWLFARLGG